MIHAWVATSLTGPGPGMPCEHGSHASLTLAWGLLGQPGWWGLPPWGRGPRPWAVLF